MKRTLADLSPGESAKVLGLAADGAVRLRLWDLGLVPGSCAACLFASPLGDPMAYRICGAVIALRRRDAARVQIE